MYIILSVLISEELVPFGVFYILSISIYLEQTKNNVKVIRRTSPASPGEGIKDFGDGTTIHDPNFGDDYIQNPLEYSDQFSDSKAPLKSGENLRALLTSYEK